MYLLGGLIGAIIAGVFSWAHGWFVEKVEYKFIEGGERKSELDEEDLNKHYDCPTVQ